MVSMGAVTNPENDLDTDETTSEYCNLRVLGEGTYNHVAHKRTYGTEPPAIAGGAHLGRGTLLTDILVYSGDTVAAASAKL